MGDNRLELKIAVLLFACFVLGIMVCQLYHMGMGAAN